MRCLDFLLGDMISKELVLYCKLAQKGLLHRFVMVYSQFTHFKDMISTKGEYEWKFFLMVLLDIITIGLLVMDRENKTNKGKRNVKKYRKCFNDVGRKKSYEISKR
jgi:hypothetical protein